MARASFKTGKVYIVRDSHRALWYMVQQVGSKSWIATTFTNAEVNWGDRLLKGNGTALYSFIMEDNQYCYEFDVLSGTVAMRKAMFSILKYGKVREDD